ncbi:MAG: F0F1 ATP synthase subunit delta [Hyphomicrobiales bacterium]|nr:MAG: F0F1 ATP synthase subunit delta [Hyphomicrobiales bacterium]
MGARNPAGEVKLVADSSSPNSGPVSGVAERYASALFDLAESGKKIKPVEKDLGRLEKLLDGSEDLMRLVRSPVFTAEDQQAAMGKVLDKAKITGIVGNFVRVVAGNRRLFVLPQIIQAFKTKLAESRGETSADVTVAAKLTPAQTKDLKATLKKVVGKDVALNVTVDASLLGGMIVKVGSRQIDTSLKTKLSSLKLALKEVG